MATDQHDMGNDPLYASSRPAVRIGASHADRLREK
jgi:hypothetical protein